MIASEYIKIYNEYKSTLEQKSTTSRMSFLQQLKVSQSLSALKRLPESAVRQ